MRRPICEVIEVGNDFQSKSTLRLLVGALIIVWSVGLVTALVWDADGNPNTDNLSQFLVPELSSTATTDDVSTESDYDDGPPIPSSGRRRLLLLWRALQALHERRPWLRAVPLRGPKEGRLPKASRPTLLVGCAPFPLHPRVSSAGRPSQTAQPPQ